MSNLLRWIDDRTNLVSLVRGVLYENVPGGPRWRYVWGSTVLFAFLVQLITGFCLWSGYSPSTQTAWESVFHIQYQTNLGWLLRGLHHYMAQAVVILMAIHVGMMVIDGAYRAPREFSFWTALVMLKLAVLFSITGWLLPFDQKGYWGSKVPTNIMLVVPVVGPYLRTLLIGGAEYGSHHTLTRFFALHAGLLPALMIGCFLLRAFLARRHGRYGHAEPRAAAADRPDGTYWPDQAVRNAAACLAVLGVVLFLVLRFGTDLTAPANPSESYLAARPEAPFLWLFQTLKQKAFEGEREVYGAVVLPGAVLTLLFLAPFIGRVKVGHAFNVLLVLALAGGIATMTFLALREDAANPQFRAAAERARVEGQRARALAAAPTGIPAGGGAAQLLLDDPFLQGPRLFKQNCASCHHYGGTDGLFPVDAAANPSSAPDLAGFASREWIAGLLDPKLIDTPRYFGGKVFDAGSYKPVKAATGRMVKYVKKDVAEYSAEQKAALAKAIEALSAEAQLRSQRAIDARDAARIEEGRKILVENTAVGCADCHSVRGGGNQDRAPDLTGYGSRQWTIDFIKDPAHERFYGRRNDRMPSFGKDQLLTDREIGLIVDWIRGEWHDPGAAPAPPPPPATQPTTRPG